MNEYKNISKAEAPKKERSKAAKSVSNFLGGEFLSKNEVLNWLPYFLLLAFLGLCYIANGYLAESTVRKIHQSKRDHKEYWSEYISTTSELMYNSKQSRVARLVETYGLKESTVPPKKIVVTEEDLEKILDNENGY